MQLHEDKLQPKKVVLQLYDWLSKVYGFGIISPDDSDRFEFEQGEKPPWMKFYGPYSTFQEEKSERRDLAG